MGSTSSTHLTLLPDLERAARQLLTNPDDFTWSDSQAYDTAGRNLLAGYDEGVYYLPAELHAAGERLIETLCESQGVHHTELARWRKTPYVINGLTPPALRHQMTPALELALDQATAPDEPRVGLQYTELGVCRPDKGLELLLCMIWLDQGLCTSITLDIPDVRLAAAG